MKTDPAPVPAPTAAPIAAPLPPPVTAPITAPIDSAYSCALHRACSLTALVLHSAFVVDTHRVIVRRPDTFNVAREVGDAAIAEANGVKRERHLGPA